MWELVITCKGIKPNELFEKIAERAFAEQEIFGEINFDETLNTINFFPAQTFFVRDKHESHQLHFILSKEFEDADTAISYGKLTDFLLKHFS
ncbi:MAG TPA: hypothetical protein VK892_11065, partial [Pyrinomonadaceae bacterium]|nr:hypothetical protein [Pyrinomonadaceae bacterium]